MEEKRTEKLSEEIKELVIERLEAMPSDKKISIGADGDFTKEELIERVKKEDNVGKKVIQIQLEYLRLMKEGVFYEKSFTDNQAQI